MPLTIPNAADAAFPAQAEPDSQDVSAIASGLGGSGVLSGCAVTAQGTPDMTVAVAAGWIRSTSGDVQVTAGNVTIAAADATNPRFDLIVADSTGAKQRRAGTAAASPAFPTPTAGDVLLAAVYVPANDTTINTNQIVDKRLLLPALRPVANAVINGNFDFWQRGTSFAAIADGAYAADCWEYQIVGATSVVHTISRSTDVPTVGGDTPLSNYSLLVDCTTADASIAAGEASYIRQTVEGHDWALFAQRPFSLSFWVKATKTGIHCVSFRNGAQDRSYIAEYTVNVTNTWEYKTITVTASPSAGTWNYTNGSGLQVAFVLAAGTTFHTTAGAWQTGSFLATANQVNACDDVANDFRIAQVMLATGGVPLPLAPYSIEAELARCLRRYEVHGGLSNGFLQVAGWGGSVGMGILVPVSFAVQKGGAPTMVVGGTWGQTNATGPTADGATVAGYRLTITSTVAGGQMNVLPDSTDDIVTATWNP